MDLKYLLGRHRMSVAASGNAASAEARHAHRGLAAGYAVRIRALQTRLGADSRGVA